MHDVPHVVSGICLCFCKKCYDIRLNCSCTSCTVHLESIDPDTYDPVEGPNRPDPVEPDPQEGLTTPVPVVHTETTKEEVPLTSSPIICKDCNSAFFKEVGKRGRPPVKCPDCR